MHDEPQPARTILAAPTIRHAIVLFALAGLAAYFNSFQGTFIFDDLGMIVDPNLHKPLQGRLAPRYTASLSFTLNYWLDGFNTRGYHLVNLLIHVAAAVTLFDLIRRTLLLPKFAGQYQHSAAWLGLVVGLLWLVHPLNTQSVTYLVQRCESMMGLFVLLALWGFHRGCETGKLSWHLIAGVSCLLASGCKELTFGVPVLALIFHRVFFGESWRKSLRETGVPLLFLSVGPLVSLGIMVGRGLLTDTGGTVGFGVPRYTPLTYLFTQLEVIPYYLWLSFWPEKLCLDYLDWPIRKSPFEVLPQAVVLLLMALATVWGLVRAKPWGFLLAVFFVILAPTSSFIPVQDPAFEHRMYLPLISVVGLVVFGLELLARRFATPTYPIAMKAAFALLVVGVLVPLTLRTVVRNEDYASDGLISRNGLESRPDNSRNRMVYAGYLFRNGLTKQALQEMELAAQRPELIPDLTGLANCYQMLGRTEEAEKLYQTLIASRPTPARKYAYALALLQVGRAKDAEPLAREAMAINDLKSRTLLASCLEELGQTEEAARLYDETRKLAPEGYAHGLMVAARRSALNLNATPAELRLSYLDAKRAVGLSDGKGADRWDTLAICLARLGKFDEAVKAAERAVAEATNQTPYEQQWLKDRLTLFRNRKLYLQP
jgi:protein O-mannosyl-transferase